LRLAGGGWWGWWGRPGPDAVTPLDAHLGFTPQSILQFGTARVQGRARQVARDLLQDAIALDEAGAFLVVLELVPTPLAGLISRRIGAPTIGIGAGPECDGQVQVISDILGLYPDFVPRHARLYAHVADTVRSVAGEYLQEVQGGAFPAAEHSSEMDTAILEGLEDPE
jgi:3-methyl-2-oxobutanoate hydroxymethyltransferase